MEKESRYSLTETVLKDIFLKGNPKDKEFIDLIEAK